MRTAFMAPLVGALIPLLPMASFGPQEPPATVPRYVGLWGADSKITVRRLLRISDAATLQRVWLEHRGADPARYSTYYNTQGVPEVDFEACTVLAIFQGRAVNSAGVRVERIDRVGKRLRVRYDDRSYQTAGPDGGARTSHAYGFFVIPRSDCEVVFEENVQGTIRGEPVWRERARLPALR